MEFEKLNPITSMMSDPTTGKFKEEMLNERVLSAIIEFGVLEEKVPAIMKRLEEVAPTLDTEFRLDFVQGLR